VIYRVATRPAKRIGSDESWDKAEKALQEALKRSGVQFTMAPGEGAFYGPKIEYSLKDGLGRVWQCGTMQVDFSMPGRIGAEYVGEDNARHTPVMLHRAIIGSMERFIGILIEHYAGAFPLWLSPEQVVVMNITERQADYAERVARSIREHGFRAAADLRNEKISYKIREHSLQKVPYQLVVGDKELQAQTVAVRARGGEDLGSMSLEAFTARLQAEAKAR
jgi:threonyl-tRNA synthetase